MERMEGVYHDFHPRNVDGPNFDLGFTLPGPDEMPEDLQGSGNVLMLGGGYYSSKPAAQTEPDSYSASNKPTMCVNDAPAAALETTEASNAAENVTKISSNLDMKIAPQSSAPPK